MRLFIAEKPSMAAELAKCLPGPIARQDGWIKTGGGCVTWGFGHILRLAEPGEYDPKYQKWSLEDLPIVPVKWRLLVTESCKKQFNVIKKLLTESSEVVHAGDPDREGQLLIDEVLEFLNNKKPVLRLLLNALDEQSIKKALTDLRDNKNFTGLKQSALGRQRADWLVGMNLSRAYTLAAQKAGYNLSLPVGRVKTPTLALVVRREREIKNFVPVDYYLLRAYLEHNSRYFSAAWKPSENQPGLDSENRLVDPAIAKALKAKFDADKDKAIITQYNVKKAQESPPLPFSLSALQLAAGKKYGYDPKTVLSAAQSLYEKKLTTYPRSDCEYLPKSQLEDAKTIIANLAFVAESDLVTWSSQADLTLQSRAWNDKKITAHHAIIPTTAAVKLDTLSEIEKTIFKLIARAYLAQFYPTHTYNQTQVELIWADEIFTASGRTVLEIGWKELYTADANKDKENNSDEEDSGTLPPMKVNDTAEVIKTTLTPKTTKPPERFTATTLLQAMKEIHKHVKSAELKKTLKDLSGIGTEATRATIISELLASKLLLETKKRLTPSAQAELLIDLLPEELTYPDSTAVWENYLQKVVDGSQSLDEFITRQVNFVTGLCAQSKSLKITRNPVVDYPCPACGAALNLRNGPRGKFWGCSAYPACKTTFDDNKGKPKLPEDLKKPAIPKKTKIKNKTKGAV